MEKRCLSREYREGRWEVQGYRAISLKGVF